MGGRYLNPYSQHRNDVGLSVSNGTLTFFENGTTTLSTIYSDPAMTVPQTNPYTLDASGRVVGDIFFEGLMTMQLRNSIGAVIRTVDNVTVITNTQPLQDQIDQILASQSVTYDTLTELLAVTDLQPGLFVETRGYDTLGDGGCNVYQTREVTVAPADGGSIIKSIGTPSVELVGTFPQGEYRAEQWGATQTNADASVGINAAIVYVGTLPGINGGTVKVVSKRITLANEVWLRYQYLWLDFSENTLININPSADMIAIRVELENLTGLLFGGGIINPIFSSADTTFTKTCIKLIDVSGYEIRGPRTVSPHVMGNASIGIQVLGRELSGVYDYYMQAERPLVIGPIPPPHVASSIGCDHWNFHNFYAVGGTSFPVITILDDTPVTQLSFTGHQSAAFGTFGVQFINSTGTVSSNGLVFENMRFEQPANSTGYCYDLQFLNSSCQNINIRGGQMSLRNGIRVRGASNLSIQNLTHSAGLNDVLNVDSTVREINIRNCFWQAGTTSTLTGQTLVFGSPRDPSTGALQPNAIYTPSNGTFQDIDTQMGISSPQFNVLNTGIGQAAPPGATGLLVVSSSEGLSAIFSLQAGASASELHDIVSVFSDTFDNPGTTNVYWDAGNNRFSIQNLSGGDLIYRVMLIGANTAF